MRKLFITLLLILLPIQLLYSPQRKQEKLAYANGRPTTLGIDWYVNNTQNQKQFIEDFEEYVQDTIYNDIFFKTENFKKLFGKKYEPNVLAFNVVFENMSCEITVNNEEKYSGFDYTNLSKEDKQYYDEYNYFLYATIIHEIMHYYFYQCIIEMQKIKNIHVNEYYDGILLYPNPEMQYGAKFIEEGICEYIIFHNENTPQLNNNYTPKYKYEISDSKNNARFEILYGYSSQFVKPFLDKYIKQYGRIKPALFKILNNKPPNYSEILNPESYFQRIENQ